MDDKLLKELMGAINKINEIPPRVSKAVAVNEDWLKAITENGEIVKIQQNNYVGVLFGLPVYFIGYLANIFGGYFIGDEEVIKRMAENYKTLEGVMRG